MLMFWKLSTLTILAMVALPGDKTWVDAYSNGVIANSACPGLNPGHGGTPATTPPPYTISFDSVSYTAGNPVTVTIRACTSTPFKGFLIQARRADTGSDQDEMLGSFSAVTGTQQTCGGSGLIHDSSTDKTEITSQWTLALPQGHIQFWFTVVESHPVYWEASKSDVLLDASIVAVPDPATLTPATVVGTECDNTSTTAAPPGDGATTNVITTYSSSGDLTVPSGCGTSLGCVSQCSGSTCETVMSWQETGDSVLYTISSVISSSTAYVAIGFSTDDIMGGDSVTGCASASDGSVLVFNAETTGRQAPVLFDDPEVNLTQFSVDNNVLRCTILRPKAASTDGKRFDVTNKWIIMFAKGSATVSGSSVVGVGYHGGNRFVTSSKFSSSDTPNVGATFPEYPLVKAHGSLMVIAWVFLASIGIVVARYYKPVWTENLLSQKVWFQIHRASMTLVLVMTIVGFVVIFLEVEDWSELREADEHLEYHPHLGVVVTALTILNPVMALFRPSGDAKRRPIFNWAHWIVGNGSHILAVITIFFGIELQKSQTPDYVVYILAGYVAWQLLVMLVLELMERQVWEKGIVECIAAGRFESHNKCEVCRGSQVTDVSPDASPDKDKPMTLTTVKRVILFVHLAVLVVFTSTTIAFVVIGDEDLQN